jgi:hypothetical protein
MRFVVWNLNLYQPDRQEKNKQFFSKISEWRINQKANFYRNFLRCSNFSITIMSDFLYYPYSMNIQNGAQIQDGFRNFFIF